MKTRVIGFCGKKGCGKDFVAGILAKMLGENGKTAINHAFADPFKRYCNESLGIPASLLWGNDEAKSTCTEYEWDQMPAFVRNAHQNKSGFMTVREVLQVVGTELGRNLWGKNIWIKAMQQLIDASPFDYVLITDVRFPNEADVVWKNGGKLWLVKGRGKEGDSHATENSIDGCTPDLVLWNNPDDTPETLSAKIDHALRMFYGAL